MFSPYQHHRAIKSFPQWVIDDCRNSGEHSFKKIVKSVIADSHIVYSNLKQFEDYKNSKILLIGGGPSFNDINIDFSNYDYTWSCNHFFKNEKLKNHKVDLALIMPEVDLLSREFIQYRDNYRPLIGFEVHDDWVNYKFDDYDKYFLMHTNFYGKIGIGARMLIFAAALKCQQVDFVGFDGASYQIKGEHSFEPGKNTLPSGFMAMTKHQIEDAHISQYKILWDFINKKYPDTLFKNLGYGKKQHKFIHNLKKENT